MNDFPEKIPSYINRKDKRLYFQVFLPKNRGNIYAHYVKGTLGKEPSQHLRELAFKFLEEEFTEEYYDELKRQDDLIWEEGKRKRKESFRKTIEKRNQEKAAKKQKQ